MLEAPLLDAQQLCVAFRGAAVGTRVALDAVSLQVRAGEIHAFLGPNGAGKTTTLRVLLDLLRPHSGSVHLFGAPLQRKSGTWRARIGFLRGECGAFHDLSGTAFLRLMAAMQQRAPVRRDEVLHALRVNERTLALPLSACSSGMRQAVFITAALQHDPELLLLDEPTNALDPLVRMAFLELLCAARERGCGVLLCSHVMDEVERVADTVTLIHHGRVRLCAAMAELRLRLPRRVRVLGEDGREHTRLLPCADAAALRALAAEEPRDVLIEDAGLDTLFQELDGEASS